MRVALVFVMALLSSSSLAQDAPMPPTEIKDAQMWKHRVGPEQALHRSQQEMDELQRQQGRRADSTGRCVFEVIVTPSGAVESFRLLKKSTTCESHQQEAEAILHSRTYKPWMVDDAPARVAIQDWVSIYPPERWGESVPFPEKVDKSTLEIQLERIDGCWVTCPSYTVSVAGDGTVQFNGRDAVAIPGHHTAHISGAAVTDLVNQFRAADFLSAFSSYKSGWSDVPTQVLSLTINGQVKRVVDHVGIEAGLPLSIRNLEAAVDEAAGTQRWVKGNGETIAALQAEHWDFGAPSAENLALYRQAIDANNSSLIGEFLRARAPVFVASDKAAPPLCEASTMGNLELVSNMLKAGKSLPAEVRNRCLADAAQSGSLALVELWLDKGADPRTRVVIDGKSDTDWIAGLGALAGAVQSGNPAVVRRLLDYKLDVNASMEGGPLLVWALERGRGEKVEIVKLLVEAGADVNARGNMGQTPLFFCMSTTEAIKPLVLAGADIEARDTNGNTPLISGAFIEALVRELLANGANPAAVANNGDTAVKRAEQYQCRPCAALIEAALKEKAGAAKD